MSFITSKPKKEADVIHIKDITKKRLNQIRISFSKLFLNKDFKQNMSLQNVEKLHFELKEIFIKEGLEDVFNAHEENFSYFQQTGDIKNPLNLKDEISQLYWGISLGYYAVNPEISAPWQVDKTASRISETTIWKRIEKSSYMQKELMKHSFIISSTLKNPDTKIIWHEHGYPNISYCYIPNENVIVDDMLWTLVCGTDSASTAINHEIAHSKGTQFTVTPKMEILAKEEESLSKQLKQYSTAKDDEKWLETAKKIARNREEYLYRFRFLDELENMFANRYSVNFGGNYDKAHLNELETVINLGERFLTPKNKETIRKEIEESPEVRIQHIKSIARNSFFANNGLIHGSNEDEWNAIGLYPEFLSGMDEEGKKINAKASFMEIREICDKFEEKQPDFALKEISEGLYNKRMTKLSKERSELVDVFFDKFVAHHMEEIYQKAEEQVKKALETAKNNQQQSSGGNGQSQSGNNQQQSSGGNGQDQSGNNQQQSSGGNGQDQSGNNQQQSSGGNGQSQSGNNQQQSSGGNGEDQSGNNQQQSSGGNGQSQSGNNQQQSSGGNGQDQSGSNQQQSSGGNEQTQSGNNQQQSSGGNGESQSDNVDKNGYPTLEDFKIQKQSIQKGEKLSKEEKEKVIKKAKLEGQNVEELAQNAEEELEETELPQRSTPDGKSDKPKGKPSKSNNIKDYIQSQKDKPTLISLEEMQRRKAVREDDFISRIIEGSYDKYQKYISQYRDEVNKTKVLIKKIITQKKLDSIKRGNKQIKKQKTIIPYNGAQTLDIKSQIKLAKKLQSNDPSLNIDDFSRFNSKRKFDKDEIIEKTELEESNFVFLIDGSGSMAGGPFKSAFATACILYEATKSFKEVNVFIYVMGEPTPTTVAKPGMSTKEVAQNLNIVQQIGGTSCNDHLVPAVEQSLKDVAENMGKHSNQTSGFIHVFPITDGGNNDYAGANASKINEAYPNRCIKALIKNNPYLTFDWFFVDGNWMNYTKPFIDDMKKKGCTQLEYAEGVFTKYTKEQGGKDRIVGKIIEVLEKRLRHSQIEEKTLNGVKKKLIEEGLKKIKNDKDNRDY